MRKNLLLLAAVLAVAGVFSLLATPTVAQQPGCEKVYGYAYKGANTLANYPIEARPSTSQNWTHVATTNADGRYTWTPSGYSDGTTFYMRLQPGCMMAPAKADPTDTPTWVFNHDSTCDSIQVDVHGACP